MRRSLALVLGSAGALAAFVAVLYGPRDGIVTLLLLGLPGAVAVALAHRLVARRERLGSLRRQFGLAGALGAGHLLLALAAGAALMFVSTHDAVLAIVIAVLGAVVALRVTKLVADGLLADVDGLRAALARVGEGGREPAPMPSGRDELAG